MLPPSEVVGGCLCGRVRYRAATDAAQLMVCHCRDCQKQAGSAFSVVLIVPATGFEIAGETKAFEHVSDSGGKVSRIFCPDCGSPIISKLAAYPEIVAIKAGTLDDPSWLNPQLHVWCASAQPWVGIPHDVAQFPGNPT
jgi:hypothetical protein